MNITIIGAGFASLKLCSLLSSDHRHRKSITLISNSKHFIFLPLIPNYISGNKNYAEIKISIEQFCAERSINFINDTVVDINPEQQALKCNSGRLYLYDFLVDGTGSRLSKRNQKGRHNYWSFWLNDYDKNSFQVTFDSLGIAEYEIMCALYSNRHIEHLIFNYNGKGKYSFKSHPTLSKIEGLGKNIENFDAALKRRKMNKGAKIGILKQRIREEDMPSGPKSIFMRNILYIGEKASIQYGFGQKNAQFASHSAFCAYQYFLDRSNKSAIQNYMNRLSGYNSRGSMLFTGHNKAHIWISTDETNKKPTLSGKIGGLIRERYYLLQLKMFYSPKKPKETYLMLYKFLKKWIRI